VEVVVFTREKSEKGRGKEGRTNRASLSRSALNTDPRHAWMNVRRPSRWKRIACSRLDFARSRIYDVLTSLSVIIAGAGVFGDSLCTGLKVI